MTADKAMREVLEHLGSATPGDEDMIISMLEARGFMIIPVGKSAEHGSVG
jgi:hypothetical protein